MGNDALTTQLTSITTKRKFKGKLRMRVVKINNINELRDCQMLIVDGKNESNLSAVYSKIRNKPVMMIADNLKDYKKSMFSLAVVDSKNTIYH